MEEVLIIGAGAAGLAAAKYLARRAIRVTLLEARNRIGGRIYTALGKAAPIPIELGAEFIHGASNAVWEIVSSAELKTHEVPGRHWIFSNHGLKEQNDSFEQIEKVFSSINPAEPDSDLCTFLKQHKDLNETAKTMCLEFVEGFHAADPTRVSIHSLAQSEEASKEDQGDRQFRLTEGYGAMLDWFRSQLLRAGVNLKFETVVDKINWQPGDVEVETRTSNGPERFRARQALVTLPIGVLQQRGGDGVRFDPELPQKQRAIEGLAMGPVVKLALEFRSAFWPVEDFGFIHAIGRRFPTWWSDARGPTLTAWAGGPRAKALESLDLNELQSEALKALAEMFERDVREIRELFVAAHRHDWSLDPFSRGAYSYTPVGATHLATELAAPVKGTLFFAGEATDSTGEQGTVHAALESGKRAAMEMIEALDARRRQTVSTPT